jgi:hypothetical protein
MRPYQGFDVMCRKMTMNLWKKTLDHDAFSNTRGHWQWLVQLGHLVLWYIKKTIQCFHCIKRMATWQSTPPLSTLQWWLSKRGSLTMVFLFSDPQQCNNDKTSTTSTRTYHDEPLLLVLVTPVKTLQSTSFLSIIVGHHGWLFFSLSLVTFLLLVTIIFGLSTVLPSKSIRLIVGCTVQDQYSSLSNPVTCFPHTLNFQSGTEGVVSCCRVHSKYSASINIFSSNVNYSTPSVSPCCYFTQLIFFMMVLQTVWWLIDQVGLVTATVCASISCIVICMMLSS